MNALAQEMISEGGLIDILNVLDERNANSGEMWHSMIRYLDVKARMKGIPIRGAFELTPLCNLGCRMCYAHMSETQLSKCGKKVLTGEQWINLIDQAVDEGLMYTLFTGGEAMLHPDFDQIYLHALQKGMLLTVNTNGLLLTEKRIKFFQLHPPKMIQVSLYGADEDEYEMVTGRRAFSQVMAGIERLKNSGLFFEVGVTPSRYMKEHGKSVIRLLDSMEVFYSVNSSLFQPRIGTGRNKENHDLSLDEYVDLFKLRAQLQGRHFVPTCCEEVRPTGGTNAEEVKGFKCAAGRSSYAITWDGYLHPCLMMTEIGCSLFEVPFAEAWKIIHHTAMEYPFPRECIGCAYQEICTVCIKQHSYGAPAGHANKKLCERAQRLALEGMIKLESDAN